MTKRRFAVWGLILALCTGTAGMTTAYAADKTISSVKLQIYTDLEVGDRIGDASIDIDSTTAPVSYTHLDVYKRQIWLLVLPLATRKFWK